MCIRDSCRDQQLEDVILAMERFTNIHRKPVVIYSDNQSSFKAGAKCLGLLPEQMITKIQEANVDITWKFNVPRGPWWGGFYERMMGVIKDVVSKVLFEHVYPTEAHLLTAVTIANRIVNSRPLTHVPTDDPSAFEAITPMHFLKWVPTSEIGQSLQFDLEYMKPKSLKHVEMQKRRRNQVLLHEEIWFKFQTCYLPKLREYDTERAKLASKPTELKIGDLALLEPSSEFKKAKHKKLFWERARIKGFLPSRDNLQRQVQIERFNLNGKKPTDLTVPIQRLYPLEELPEVDFTRYDIKPRLQEEVKNPPATSKQHLRAQYSSFFTNAVGTSRLMRLG